MVPDRTTAAALALLSVSAALLANPLYLHPDDRGNQFLSAQPTNPAESAARLSPDARRLDRLPVVARHAASRSLENGSFRVGRDVPPLAVRLLEREWSYLGSVADARLYRHSVTVGNDSTTVTFEPVSAGAVEDDLGLTPPEALRETDSSREVAWLADRSDAVVAVEQFGPTWEPRLDGAVADGELTVPNGNDAATLSPLSGEVDYVVDGDEAYRTNVRTTNGSVTLRLDGLSDQTLLDQTNVAVVDTEDLDPAERDVVVRAIETEDDSVRFDRAEANLTRLRSLRDHVVDHRGRYYVVRTTHVDDISLLPLFRTVFTWAGVVFGAVGLALGYSVLRSRR